MTTTTNFLRHFTNKGGHVSLIWNPVVDHVDHCETTHCRHFDQRIFHRWIAEVVPLLQKMNTQYGVERIGWETTFGAGLGIVGIDHINQCFPRHQLLHRCQKMLAPGALLGCGLLGITESELLGSRHASPLARGHDTILPRKSLVFQSLLSKIGMTLILDTSI